MFGTYQHSNLRIEISASAAQIEASLTQANRLKKWLWPQRLEISDMTGNRLVIGQVFESQLGPVTTAHKVELLSSEGVRFLLSGSIDGFHEWQWGDGWVQSRLEGVSLLPLNLGQTASLLRLKQYLQTAQST
ncbi:MAG: hypothetical protein ACFB16_12480 [Phormidesmis sp.]